MCLDLLADARFFSLLLDVDGYLSAEPCLTNVLPSAENFPWARPDVRPEERSDGETR